MPMVMWVRVSEALFSTQGVLPGNNDGYNYQVQYMLYFQMYLVACDFLSKIWQGRYDIQFPKGFNLTGILYNQGIP